VYFCVRERLEGKLKRVCCQELIDDKLKISYQKRIISIENTNESQNFKGNAVETQAV
jgi:hypothetical protein